MHITSAKLIVTTKSIQQIGYTDKGGQNLQGNNLHNTDEANYIAPTYTLYQALLTKSLASSSSCR